MIIALFAVDDAGGMGNNGNMPWPANRDDMKWFRSTTQDQVVVMGRRSWESPDMPKPLPKRHNVVFTHNFFENQQVEQIRGDVVSGLNYIQERHSDKNVFVIGGPAILKQARPIIEQALITKITGEYPCDTRINLSEFLSEMKFIEEIDLGSCKVEKYERI